MNTKNFTAAMGELNDKYIYEALYYKKRPASFFLKTAALAACFALIIFAGISGILKSSQSAPAQLPLITVPENFGGSAGFEGYLAYDISDLVNENPWDSSAVLTTLPVYKNLISFDENNQIMGARREEMEQILFEVFQAFGIKETEVEIADNTAEFPTQIRGEANGIIIYVTSYYNVTIEFSPAKELPQEYKFTDYSKYEKILNIATYLQEAYKEIIDMENPITNIYGGDYDFNLNRSYNLSFYEGEGSLEERIFNYNFRNVKFAFNADGDLWLIGISAIKTPEKIGDYPVISAEEAKALLLSGEYITDVPYEMPGEIYIKKTELVYRAGEFASYSIPYYLFYVELPEENHGELKTYGAYYVPAIDPDYISD